MITRRHRHSPVAALVGIVVTIAASGCTFKSPMPLGLPGDAWVDSELLGEWHAVDKDGDVDKKTSVTIMQFNDQEYFLKLRGVGGGGIYRAYATRVSEVPFLNVQELDPGVAYELRKYRFFTWTIKGNDILLLRALKGDLVRDKYKSIEDFRGLVEQHLGKPELTEELVRAKRVN